MRLARTICSSKYVILVGGKIADVEACIAQAKETGGLAIMNALMIPNVDEKIFPAIAGTTTLDSPEVDGFAYWKHSPELLQSSPETML